MRVRLVIAAVAVVALAAPASAAASTSGLQREFAAASREFQVPASVLLAVSYQESRWEQHGGQPSTTGGYGVMHLIDVPDLRGKPAPAMHTLGAAARMLRVSRATLRKDRAQNIRGGAALLAAYARETTGRLPAARGAWYGAVARYSGSRLAPVARGFARDVYSRIRRGAVRRTSTGDLVRLRGRRVRARTATARRLHLSKPRTARSRAAQQPPPPAPECPRSLACRFDPAAYAQNDPNDPGNYGNYDLADRPRDGLEIRYLVIHDTEETFADTLATFQNPLSFVSSHYVVRSSDGLVDQMVPTRDVAWHAGNWYVNTHSVGIENEGFATEGATWFSEPLYRSTARLVRYLARRYGIPLDREHVVGHDDVPGPGAAFQAGMHWDPGPYWNWSHFMRLAGARPGHGRARPGHPVRIAPSFRRNRQTVTYCDPAPCHTLPPQGSNFVYLHSAPSFGSQLIADEALTGTNLEPDGVGTTQANDWGDKAVAGHDYYLRSRRGSWAEIDYGGKAAWFFDPHGRNTRGARGGTLVTPKAGSASIPVYGAAYPSSRPAPTLQYEIPAGQAYVAKDLVRASYYSASTFNDPASYQVITEPTRFYEVSFNHRIAYLRADDVRVLRR